jgi:GH25 family lysozyme M1 (1,4-beta-N-acetylmuramidase)
MRGVVLAIVVVALALVPAAGAQTAPQGIDVSHWQGQIGWLQVGAAGYDFAFAKATEGTTYTDPTYGTNRSGAGAAGMKFGAYHFARPTAGSDAAAVASGIAQADYFVAYAQPRRADLLPVLDLERSGGLSVTRLVLWTKAYLDPVNAPTGVRRLIYASPSFCNTSLGDTPVFAQAGHRLWIAHWTSASLPLLPAGSWGGQGWTFWQYTDCSKVPGISGCVDGDRLNGSSLTPSTIPALPAGLPVSSAVPTIVGPAETG